MKLFNLYRNVALMGVMLSLVSCEAIEGIFKAGMWSGIIIVALIVGLVLWLLRKFTKR